MKLTTKGHYAVTALLHIACETENTVALSDISEKQAISLSYLEQLFSKLRKEGLVASVRGANGGYQINQELTNITVLDIISAVDTDIQATQCSGKGNCQQDNTCITHDLWTQLTSHISEYLDSITLKDLQESHLNNKPLDKILIGKQ